MFEMVWAKPTCLGESEAVCAAAQVTEETEELRFNTGISALMEFVNGAYKWEEVPRAALEPFVLMLAPYAPHLAEELWQVTLICISSACQVLFTLF